MLFPSIYHTLWLHHSSEQGAQQECCGSPEPPSEWNWNVIFTSGSHPAEQNRKKCDFIRIFGIFNIFDRAPPSHLWTDLDDSFTIRELSKHRFYAVQLFFRSDFIQRSYIEKRYFIGIFGFFNIFDQAPPSHLWTDLDDSFTVRELSKHRFCAVYLLFRSDFIQRSYTEKTLFYRHFRYFHEHFLP